MSSDYLRARIEAAGWDVCEVSEPALTVQGRVFPVANFWVARGDLHGVLTAAFDGEVADEVERCTEYDLKPELTGYRTLADRGWRLKAKVGSVARRAGVRADHPCADPRAA